MEPTYTLVYDASKTGLDFSSIFQLIIGVVIGTIFLVYNVRKNSKKNIIFASVWIFMWALLGGIGAVAVNSKILECRQLVNSKQYDITEGIVKEFHPMPFNGHDTERFTVNGVKFSYSEYDLSKGGFNHTSSHGGPIRDGLQVKIAHKNAIILMLWVLEPHT